MKTSSMKQKLILSALTGAILIPGSAMTVMAADSSAENNTAIPVAGIESALKESYQTAVKDNIDLYLVQNNEGEYLNMAFSNVGDFTYIRNAPGETNEWVGKLYSNSTAEVLEYNGDWIRIRSGSVEGYVPAISLFTGNAAREHAAQYEQRKAIVNADVLNVRDGQGTAANVLTRVLAGQEYKVTGDPVDGWYPIQAGDIDGWVSGEYVSVTQTYAYAEARADEEARLAAEEAAKQQAVQEAAVIQTQSSKGQEVINYACQFIGNPYVWGGTSLTEGADCSGFVQSVYANFGISLPRTTWDMESVGTAVAYEQALPGDIVLYDGHVGLYMGDGNIVNAQNPSDGIGICPATYAPIITVRRVL